MPAIAKFHGIMVRLMKLPYRGLAIYANRGEDEVVMDAGSLRVISGSAPARVVELVLQWAQAHDTHLRKAQEAVEAHHAPCGAPSRG